MEKFYFEVPSIDRKKDAIDFINEFNEYNSRINGVGGLNRYLDNYEGWLEKLEDDYTREPNEEKVPARTYFMVRENDKKIIGMINIRLALNEKFKKYGGHIGFGIRPTERGKGYNKINLYLGLKVCNQYGIDKAYMDADLDNPASWKTMEALGGERVRQYFEDEIAHCEVVCYSIDVKKSLEKYKAFEKYVFNMELIDVYDSLGNKTGRVVERGRKDETFGEDEHIAVAIIYIENDKGEFLIQKTSKEKGGNYSSTGGHINHGEDAYGTIVREVKEELGLDVSNDNIISLGHICVDFPVRFMFYLKKNIDLNEITIQKDEVESVSYMSVNEIKDILDKGLMHKAHYKVLEKVLEYKKRTDIK